MLGIESTAALEELAAQETRDDSVEDAQSFATVEEVREDEGIEFDIQPMPLQVEELGIVLYETLILVDELRNKVSDLEARIEDHNQRASHKI